MLKTILSKENSFWIKVLIFSAVLSLLWYTLYRNESLNQEYIETIRYSWQNNSIFLFIAILLIPLNISLEALKWKFLIKKLEHLSFKEALFGVLAGISMGFITPHSIGDYAARIISLKHQERFKGIGAVFLCRIGQFYITLYFGTIALVVYFYKALKIDGMDSQLLICFAIANNILFGLLYFFHKKIFEKIETWALLKKVVYYFEIIKQYTFNELNILLLFSLLRYLVFSSQFILFLLFFNVSLPLHLMLMGVSFIFFVKSIIPTFLDLGVREAAAIVFFSLFGFKQEWILFASLSLWLSNIAFPALMGLVVVFTLKVSAKEITFLNKKP